MSTPHYPSGQEPLRSELVDDPDMRELVEMFVDELPDRVRSVRSAWENHEYESLRRLAHQLKGAGAGYGFPIISETAGGIEDSLRDLGGSPSESQLDELTRRVEQLVSQCSRAVV